MGSNKQKREAIDAKRQAQRDDVREQARREIELSRRRDFEARLARGEVAVEPSRLAPSNSYSIPHFVERGTYQPQPFVCKDCGVAEVWTPLQQKWWYETAKGDVFTTATRCRACRARERARKAAARRAHLEGLARRKLPAS
ncbi:zinc-ribbon domain containing protein [Bradyrhizobium sp. U87765 SZCCT0131]|uniref:zinc-ribbon domain containing protein n=1 Tax=unclassified Bradyrhizobium TaxID=2631580 RepID=UPI001BAC9C1D|nr:MULTISPECIES: zinc-ribbon domain containing protein [unclassified Bradyrhizobium]MBR1217938.1 zinc-ribbon domain containing protein [Bradyrhizobium sp. U87765 SZCCT0131]MBR1261116.1 zinc-ribbon domain containing protein [Bradyrhizobium sp. U87765 SZCCT0134]MBR1303436.1 zinc-ribbon domain containing protein [Bradyrhizobium sp. U87765 SZCCT0110]MBR1319042.1 zinc-ribbon domain containing protein [Bradyrhizobium sp. U87765 SZCCT0109]MBR1347367.1 zinc-ribbon domain containing protein [Bradyrhizo